MENKTPQEHGIKLRTTEHGSQKIKCPECQPPHKLSDNPLTVTINAEGTVWYCHHCDWRGSYFDNPKSSFPLPKKTYTKPPPPKQNNTDDMYSFFKGRGIEKKVVDKFKIFDENKWFGFQYFNEKEELENIKYRTADKGFRQTSGAKSILYNYNNVHNKETVVFVEGEMDVLSCEMVGYPATTLPNGAPKEAKFNKNDARFTALTNCPLVAKKIIIFTDTDTSGRALHKELLHRFGKDISWFVRLPEDCKDANDVLMKHGKVELQNIINKAEPYPIDGLYTANDYYGQLHDLYEGNYEKPLDIGIQGLDDIYKIMPSTFHTITGIPNHGKSLFLDQILLTLAKNHDWKFAVFSPEHSTEFHIRRMAQMYLKKGFDEGFDNRMSREELNQAIEFIHNHFYFVETKDSVPSIQLIHSIVKSSIFKHGINGFVIDPFNEISAKRSGNAREDEHIRDFISLCKRFSRTYGIVTWVVAHPTKLPKGTDGSYLPPTAYDISGAAHWHNMADAVLTVHRDFDTNTTSVITRKIREQDLYGKIGEAKFVYNFNDHCFKPAIVPKIGDWSEIAFNE